jgi:hypothetical protein
MKLIQLRNTERRVGDGVLFSEFMGTEKSDQIRRREKMVAGR